MSWKEFSILLNGLGADTPLVKIASIRSENDSKRLKEFSPEAKRIRNEWRKRQFDKKSKQEQDAMMNEFYGGVLSMLGVNNETD